MLCSPYDKCHDDHHEEISHHVIGDEPEWSVLRSREKCIWRDPREKCESHKKALPVMDTERKHPEKRKYESDIVEWCDTPPSVFYSPPEVRDFPTFIYHTPVRE
jgi:hypothetical protein